MLDIKTKKAIDDARNILVGKIPSPNTQVEQITIAMLYKFMDDMDQQSKELGGKITFFADDFAQYSWRTIMSKTLGAQERFNRYVEALEKFYSRPKLPQTFKDIFKNATVPYRDADVLTMFLRTIDEGLSYGDSEQLGDAYEYLLMILGSQGDLGQFRTPRHIIDMMVEIVDPQKGDYILDPACGTAGFLISAYKHILKNNMDEKPGDKMNFDERVEVLKHITGYDIEPSMVRIAEMNMFLHGATNPDIYEYDTLTMEDKWEEKFDVIMANPPFMTPKGGIKPHKRFGIQANRSEILFVDYISSHLRAGGRAGIIVPDGVVSKKDRAYQIARKKLIDNYLYAVVSLPSGIFNPYSPVSTFILFLDKKIANEKEEILFVEINNDGYSLNKNRKKIKGDEIPEVINLIKNYKNGIEFQDDKVIVVKKTDIIENNYELSMNKYKIKSHDKVKNRDSEKIIGDMKTLLCESTTKVIEIEKLIKRIDKEMLDKNWEVKPLKETCQFYNGKAHENVIDEKGKYFLVNAKFISSDGNVYKKTNANLFPLYKNDVAMVMSDVPNGKALAKCFFVDEDNKYTLNQRICAIRSDFYNPKFLYKILNRNKYLLDFNDGNSQTNLRKDDILSCPLIVPPMDIQNEFVELVNIIEEYEKKVKNNKNYIDELLDAKIIEYFD